MSYEEKYNRLHTMLIEEVGEEKVTKIMGYIDMSEEPDNTEAIREVLNSRHMIQGFAFDLTVSPKQERKDGAYRRRIEISQDGMFEHLIWIGLTDDGQFILTYINDDKTVRVPFSKRKY